MIYIDAPRKESFINILCLFDTRTKTDSLLENNNAKGHPVYRANPMLKEILGAQMTQVTRIALFEYGSKPSSVEIVAAQKELLRHFKQVQYSVIMVFPTPSTDIDEGQATKGTACWNVFKTPDSMEEMRGTLWQYSMGTYIMPMYPCVPVIDETQKLMNQRWAKRPKSFLQSYRDVPKPQVFLTVPDVGMCDALTEMMNSNTLSIDIETIDSQGVITAIGLATESHAVSIPFDSWQPSKPGCGTELGVDEIGPLGKAIHAKLTSLLAANTTKVGHNVLFDIKRLETRGFKVNGTVQDTMAAHAIVYPTLSHGLQKCCATEFLVNPWKSEFKVPGLSREDERFWHYEPAALRKYNAYDAFNTFYLWDSLRKKLGIRA